MVKMLVDYALRLDTDNYNKHYIITIKITRPYHFVKQ